LLLLLLVVVVVSWQARRQGHLLQQQIPLRITHL
jgi:hypothetical protein